MNDYKSQLLFVNVLYNNKLAKVTILFLLLVFSNNIFCQFSFAPFQSITTGSSAHVVCIGDVNNDGLNDVVMGTTYYFDSTNDYKVFVYIQTSTGTLLSPVKYPYTVIGDGLNSIAIGDVNNDHLNDVIVGFKDSIGIFYQNISGTLNSVQVLFSEVAGNSAQGYRVALDVGDLNNDGLNDIAIAHSGQSVTSILYQTINNGFLPVLLPYGAGYQIVIADVNNDLLNDIVFIKGVGIGTLTQNNSGVLTNYQTYNNTTPSKHAIDVGDLNNDGLNDVAEISGYDSLNFMYFRVGLFFQDQNTHLFQNAIQLQTIYGGETMKIADLNCDGKNEIITANSGYVEIYDQNNNQNYQYNSSYINPYATHYNAQAMAIGDINSDHKLDIVIANYNSGLVIFKNQSVLLGNCCPLPLIPSKPVGDTVICNDNDTSVYKLLIPYSGSLSWHLIPIQSGSIISSNKDSCQIVWNNSWQGIAGVYVISSDTCGYVNSDTLKIIKSKLLDVYLGNDTTLCLSDTLILKVTHNFNNFFQWQNNSSDSIFTITTGGLYYVNSYNICGITSDSIIVTNSLLPNINLSNDTILCNGNSINLDVTIIGNNTYLWQDGSTEPVYTVTVAGTYSVTVSDSNNCYNSKSILVNELTSPVIYFPSDTTLCMGVPLLLDAYNSNCDYLWQDGSTLPQFYIQKSDKYIVTVTNLCGSVIDSVNVVLIDCSTYLDVPSAFSPNNDGNNDVLYAVGKNVDNIIFIIYNRWGEKVFESKSLTEGWDGTYKGTNLSSSVFMYHISARSTISNESIEKVGNISLIR